MDGLDQIARDLHIAHQDIHKQLLQLELCVAETDARRQLAELNDGPQGNDGPPH